jgi:hypothetical protein
MLRQVKRKILVRQCIAFALIGFAAREPKRVSATALEPIESLEEAFEPHQ